MESKGVHEPLVERGDDEEEEKKQRPRQMQIPQKRQMIEQFEQLYQAYKARNTINKELVESLDREDPSQVFIKNDSDSVIGMIHAFVLLKPVLQSALAE